MQKKHMELKLTFVLCLTLFVEGQKQKTPKRPFFVIGHMVNSIPEIEEFLDKGANVLESDISFFPNGSVKEVYHGPPCDCFRVCTSRAKLSDYLNHIRDITSPSYNGSYSERMIFQFFDMKLKSVESSNGKYHAGQDIADHVLDYLWGNDYKNRKLVRVLLYINTIKDLPTMAGFRDRFHERGVPELLENVGYDGGVEDNSEDIYSGLTSLGIDSNIWQGDGTINCFSAIYPTFKLIKELAIRDGPEGYIDKVYHWTIDDSNRMAASLSVGVDGMITNVPQVLVHVLSDLFSDDFRLATTDDDPFIKYISAEKELM